MCRPDRAGVAAPDDDTAHGDLNVFAAQAKRRIRSEPDVMRMSDLRAVLGEVHDVHRHSAVRRPKLVRNLRRIEMEPLGELVR